MTEQIKGAIKIPYNSKYWDNSEGCGGEELPCIVCGNPIKRPFDNSETWFLRLGPGGKSFAIPKETPDQAGAEMGCFPIGPRCLKKYPKLKALAFKM